MSNKTHKHNHGAILHSSLTITEQTLKHENSLLVERTLVASVGVPHMVCLPEKLLYVYDGQEDSP